MPSDSSRWQMASAIPLSSVEWLKAFGVRRLAFGVWRSAFGVRRSAFVLVLESGRAE